jgi:hypothetical protein
MKWAILKMGTQEVVPKREKGLTRGRPSPLARGLNADQKLGPYAETGRRREIKHGGTFCGQGNKRLLHWQTPYPFQHQGRKTSTAQI